MLALLHVLDDQGRCRAAEADLPANSSCSSDRFEGNTDTQQAHLNVKVQGSASILTSALDCCIQDPT